MVVASTLEVTAASLAAGGAAWALSRPQKPILILAWLAFCTSVFLSMAGRAMETEWSAIGPVAASCGSASCGWFWLLTRALFRAGTPFQARHFALVGAIMLPTLIELGIDQFGRLDPSLLASSEVPVRMLGNIRTLASSAALVLCVREMLLGWSSGLPSGEKTFRVSFLAAYIASVTFSIVWPSNSADFSFAATWRPSIQAICCLAFVFVTAWAVRYRLANPLPEPVRPALAPRSDTPAQGAKRPSELTAEDRALAERVRRLVESDAVYLQASLKISDVAARLGEPEYKVTRAITGALGCRNFNQFINAYRIERAKALLSDPAMDHLSILAVSMEAGFGSLGPFNRAFRAAVGRTPREYRAEASSAQA